MQRLEVTFCDLTGVQQDEEITGQKLVVSARKGRELVVRRHDDKGLVDVHGFNGVTRWRWVA